MNLRDMKIAARLALGFGLIAGLMALITLITYVRVNQVDEDFGLVLNDRFPKVVSLAAMNDQIQDIARAMRNMLLVSGADRINKERAAIDEARALIAKTLEHLDKTIATPKGREALKNLTDARAAYVGGQGRFLELMGTGATEEAKKLLLTDLEPLQLGYLRRVEEMVAFQTGLMKEAGALTASNISTVKAVLVGSALAAAVASVLLALWIIRAITQPLNHAVKVARAVADGDLSQELRVEGSNETAQLLRALAEMQDRLNSIVGEVRQGAESVATASAQIAQGNQDLSSRTEEQASALEETAASMEQLSSTVKENANNAQQANQLAITASSVAVEGGAVVGQVVQTMKGINDSSRRIADIIGVIDGIAFQTNILALNAAVEAARAGEQGRGFAVVASEVRSLAQRSAEAAKEIKSLISASVEGVQAGTQLVDQAGVKMGEVVNAIKRVTDIVGEISNASQEQAAGVAQVGEAVTQMDHATQQNAALVEESAAAAESLKAQATQLVTAVAVFRLSHAAAAGATIATRPRSAPAVVQRPSAPRAPAAKASARRSGHGGAPAKSAEPAPAAAAADDTAEWTTF